MKTITEEVLIEDCTVANLIWRKFRRQPTGFIERVLELNRGLSANVVVPVGTKIIFPIEDLEQAEAQTDIIRMWD